MSGGFGGRCGSTAKQTCTGPRTRCRGCPLPAGGTTGNEPQASVWLAQR
jgi:hypothetical protein